MGVKFGTEEGTFGPLLLSKLNTGRFALRAMLPVTSSTYLNPGLGAYYYTHYSEDRD